MSDDGHGTVVHIHLLRARAQLLVHHCSRDDDQCCDEMRNMFRIALGIDR